MRKNMRPHVPPSQASYNPLAQTVGSLVSDSPPRGRSHPPPFRVRTASGRATSCVRKTLEELPGRGEGLRVQEEGSSHQIQALITESITQKLGTHPPLGQASHT